MLSKPALLSAILAVSLPLPAQAHDIYSHLRSPLGESCCDDRDCRPAPYRFISGHWQMFVDRRWIDVPDYTIQYRALLGDRSETGGGHWCGFSMTTPSKEDLEPVYTTALRSCRPRLLRPTLSGLAFQGGNSHKSQYGTGARRLVARLNSFLMCGSTKIKNFAGVTQCTVPSATWFKVQSSPTEKADDQGIRNCTCWVLARWARAYVRGAWPSGKTMHGGGAAYQRRVPGLIGRR